VKIDSVKIDSLGIKDRQPWNQRSTALELKIGSLEIGWHIKTDSCKKMLIFVFFHDIIE
jgi:hypothetical protein